MAAWNTGKVVGQKQWNDRLFSLFVDAEIEPYEAGQFAKLGLEVEGQIIGRPYSLVNAPDRRPLEFYYIHVPDGPFTDQLVKLQEGDSILISPRANGFMVLDEVPQSRHLWLIATGTGVGPFLAMLDTQKPWQRFEKVVLVYAVRTHSELSYQERIANVQTLHAEQFIYVPFMSREVSDFAMPGRIPDAIVDQRLETRAGLLLSADNSQVMMCGNPQMVEDTMKVLIERGLKKHRRKDPGQITVESYW
jgi:ferredoxin--NADP+ reductase